MSRLVDVLTGIQYGDESKGTESYRRARSGLYQLVVRGQGGNNAGHTTMTLNLLTGQVEPLVLHALPSAISVGEVLSAVGAGAIISPSALLHEIESVRSFGIDPIPRLMLDGRCCLTMIYHRIQDMVEEWLKAKSGSQVGTTAQGIGPTYADKASRTAIHAHELLDAQRFEAHLRRQLEEKTRLFAASGIAVADWKAIFRKLEEKDRRANAKLIEGGRVKATEFDYSRFCHPLDYVKFLPDALVEYYESLRQQIVALGIIGDVCELAHRTLQSGGAILFEGAQGSALDIDFGSYPNVTSSHTTAGGVCVGIGIGPTMVREVRGVAKAFMSKVGSGGFPTQFENDLSRRLQGSTDPTKRRVDDEQGATTGRVRNIGWFDSVIARTGCRLNGVTKVTLAKLDALSGEPELKVGRCWTLNGREIFFMTDDSTLIGQVGVSYLTCSGWTEDIRGLTDWQKLPKAAKDYIKLVEGVLNIGATEPIVIDRVSTGPAEADFIEVPA
ncbi:MAG: adenylosuccinate synthetase [Patescibacteria group bacterium]|nr:adenylosuccinate synthetase [Patescibacteria group bacterium]